MRSGISLTLEDIAIHIGATLYGDSKLQVQTIASLEQAMPGALSFLSHKKYRRHLSNTKATAVILTQEYFANCPTAALIHANPHLAFAKVANLLYPQSSCTSGIHPSAVIDSSATIAETAWIGPLAVIGARVCIKDSVFVGPNCTIDDDCIIGDNTRLIAHVTICQGTKIGSRTTIQPGAVIGADGFGFAKNGDNWLRIPQIGRVRIGNDVEIGANTTIDRGSIEDTVIADGAILDNLIQIGHNVHIGENTAIVACTGISGSTKIGRDCLLGGNVGIAGHLDIGDGVCLAAGSRVTRNLSGPANYGGVLPVDIEPLWRRNVARLRHLDELVRRIRQLEHLTKNMPKSGEKDEN
jgi:UDP-3-O-[3-hydroxymyristoyl] glucosamine N-acyltransferase